MFSSQQTFIAGTRSNVRLRNVATLFDPAAKFYSVISEGFFNVNFKQLLRAANLQRFILNALLVLGFIYNVNSPVMMRDND